MTNIETKLREELNTLTMKMLEKAPSLSDI